MPNTRKILIVDDDPGLRDALTEQLSLHEEFEAVAAENGSKGLQAVKAGQIDGRMKDDAILVNVARGEIVQERP